VSKEKCGEIMQIENITFNEIKSIWENYLWKNRETPIKPMSSITIKNSIDMSIYNNVPTFFALKDNGIISGVISGFSTSETDYRCRGIYVFPKYRGQNLSRQLFQACVNQAIKEDKSLLWSIPRKSAYYAYKAFGFKRITEWSDEFEFGPNCFAELVIK
jgi:N-acetylglutamate synthase-like GNAT family acetyltransferase